MELRQRKRLRLPERDYGGAGGYFITACIQGRTHLLGTVVMGRGDHVGRDDLGAPRVALSQYGRIVEKYIISISSAYPNVFVDKYVIMPNHIHLLIQVTPQQDGAPRSSRPTQMVPRVMAALKRFSNQEAGFDMWQTSYHDHIIRNDADYRRILEYIDTNPAKWREDCYYVDHGSIEGG